MTARAVLGDLPELQILAPKALKSLPRLQILPPPAPEGRTPLKFARLEMLPQMLEKT